MGVMRRNHGRQSEADPGASAGPRGYHPQHRFERHSEAGVEEERGLHVVSQLPRPVQFLQQKAVRLCSFSQS